MGCQFILVPDTVQVSGQRGHRLMAGHAGEKLG